MTPPALTPAEADRLDRERVARRGIRWGLVAVSAAAGLAMVFSAYDVGLSPSVLWDAMRSFVAFFSDTMWPPDFHDVFALLRAALVTLEIAFLGTALATIVSLPISFCAAVNIAPHRALRVCVRTVVMVCRAVPDFVFALMFIAAVGLGPLPAVLGLGLHSIGMLAKLYAERIEEIDPGPYEALGALGANRLQSARLAVLPEVLPSLVSTTLYRIDVNIRSSIVLGLVGAGGIGFELITAIQGLEYRRALAAIVVVLVLVVCVETVSTVLRRRLM